MKKLRYMFCLIVMFIFGLTQVNANSCTINFFTYFSSDYADVPYCSSGFLNARGCYVLSVASILKSYGKDVNPKEIAGWLCDSNNGYRDEADGVTYGNISVSQTFHDTFGLEMNQIYANAGEVTATLAAVDQALAEKKMVLVSVEGGIFTENKHYIVIAAKDGERYFVINTSTSNPNSPKFSGWYTKESIIENAVKRKNANWWSVKPSDCDEISINYNSNGSAYKQNIVDNYTSECVDGETGRLVDCNESYFPDIGQNNGNSIFYRQNGAPTAFKKFLDGIFLLIRIVTPVIVIVLSTIDYLKAVASANADDLKKTNKKTIKRVAIGLIILFLPSILELLFYLLGLYNMNTGGIGN